MLEFRLVYQGLLRGNDDSKSKHAIRRYFHKQLLRLWDTKQPLKGRAAYRYRASDGQTGITIEKTGIDFITDRFSIGGQKFVPIVQKEWSLSCALEILILRRDHFPVITSGDLDNRVKTLLDALRIPQANEYCDGEENPLYCLLENDNLVSELRVTADLLMCPPEQIVHDPLNVFGELQEIRDIHTIALIHVMIKPTHVAAGNLDFV
jgi:hypothetical protein